jgi:hypothetical protein
LVVRWRNLGRVKDGHFLLFEVSAGPTNRADPDVAGLIRVHFWQLHFSGLDSAFFSAGFRFPGRPRRSAGSSFLVPVASFFFVDLGVWISWGRFN